MFNKNKISKRKRNNYIDQTQEANTRRNHMFDII